MSGIQQVPPPEKLIPDLQASIANAMRDVAPGMNAFVVDVDTQGGNAAIVHKSTDGSLTVEAWIAKKWKGDVRGGARVTKTW